MLAGLNGGVELLTAKGGGAGGEFLHLLVNRFGRARRFLGIPLGIVLGGITGSFPGGTHSDTSLLE